MYGMWHLPGEVSEESYIVMEIIEKSSAVRETGRRFVMCRGTERKRVEEVWESR